MLDNKSGLPLPTSEDEAQVDAEAAAILHSATQAVKAILKRRAALDRAGREDVPLIVLAGEDHAMPAHHLHHMLLLKGLMGSGEKTVFGYEMCHNLLSREFFAKVNRHPDPAIASCLQNRDQNGALTLRCFSAFSASPHAEHARATLFRFLDRHNMPTRFTDTEFDRRTYGLNLRDPLTAQSIKDCLKETPDYLGVLTAHGMRVRNYHAARIMADFARTQDARIAVQQCGHHHMAGRKSFYPECHSLSACFRAEALPVLALPLANRYFNEDHLPEDHNLQADELLILRGLPEKKAIYDPGLEPSVLVGFAIPDMPVDLPDQAAEAAWVSALLARIGIAVEDMSVASYGERRKNSAHSMTELFTRWENEFYPSPA